MAESAWNDIVLHMKRSVKSLQNDVFCTVNARRQSAAELAGEKREIGFGSQIRSYTLHPQQRVKDHRTETERGNVEAVLDGDLDPFIRATLLWQSGRRSAVGSGQGERNE